MKSLYQRLYTPAGDLRKTAYLYKGDVVNPKDCMKDGVMAIDLGRKHGVKKLEGILSMHLERKKPSALSVQVISQDGSALEAYSFSYNKPLGSARVKRNPIEQEK